MTVADRIRTRREKLGLSQEELAKRLGLKSRSSVTRIEKSGDNISLKDVENIKIKELLRKDSNPSVGIYETIDNLLNRAMQQNFVPVVDDSNIFIGIVTRKKIIEYFVKEK